MLQIESPSQHPLLVRHLLVHQNLMVQHLLALQNLHMLPVLSGVHLLTHLRTMTSSNKLLAQLLLPQVLLMKIRYNLQSASNEKRAMFLIGHIGYKHERYRKLLELYEYMFVFPYSFWGYLHMPQLTN